MSQQQKKVQATKKPTNTGLQAMTKDTRTIHVKPNKETIDNFIKAGWKKA